jgi:hypothetical protein
MNSCNDNINGFGFVLYSTLVAFVIADNLEPAEQTMLGIFLDDVGSNLLSIASFNKYILKKEDSSEDETDIDIPKKPSFF